MRIQGLRGKTLWCGIAAAAIAVAGCSSSGSSSSSGGGSAGSTPTPVVAPSSSAATGSGSASPAALPAALAAAKANVAAALKGPTSIPITLPLKTKPPTGKTIVYLQCEVAQCVLEGNGLKSAAAAIGWTYKTLNFQAADPSTLITAMNTALQYKPIAVYFSGVPYDLWKSEIPKYKAAGTYIVPSSVPDMPTNSTVLTSLGADKLYSDAGKLLADQVAVDSGGANAKVLFSTVPAYTIFGPMQAGYESEMKVACPTCSTTVVGATIPQVTSNQLVPALVSALKRDPGISYVVSVNGPFVQTLPSALQSAGLQNKVRIITFSGTTPVEQMVQQGQIESTTGYGYSYEGWLGVDVVLRAMQGQPITSEYESLPLPLLTKATITKPSDSDDVPADYQAEFRKLWLIDN